MGGVQGGIAAWKSGGRQAAFSIFLKPQTRKPGSFYFTDNSRKNLNSIPTYIPTYLPTYLPTYIRTYTYVHISTHMYKHAHVLYVSTCYATQ